MSTQVRIAGHEVELKNLDKPLFPKSGLTKIGLIYLANQACITFHLALARADKPHHPDRLVFDLDPVSRRCDEGRAGTELVSTAPGFFDRAESRPWVLR